MSVRTVEEILYRTVVKQLARDLYGIHGANTAKEYIFLMLKEMALRILADTDVSLWLTDVEIAEMDGVLIKLS